jgi:hypothetical protein
VNPIERPAYARRPHPRGLEIEVEAADWPRLVDAATLALSDAVRPLGLFDTWTARRAAVAGPPSAATLAAWLAEVASLWREGSFLPAFLEDLRAGGGRVAAVLRGGRTDPADAPPEFPLASVPADAVSLAEGGGDAPWRARFVLAR